MGRRGSRASGWQAAMRAAAQQEERERRRDRRSETRQPYKAVMKEDGTTHNYFGDGQEPHGHAAVDESGDVVFMRDEDQNYY